MNIMNSPVKKMMNAFACLAVCAMSACAAFGDTPWGAAYKDGSKVCDLTARTASGGICLDDANLAASNPDEIRFVSGVLSVDHLEVANRTIAFVGAEGGGTTLKPDASAVREFGGALAAVGGSVIVSNLVFQGFVAETVGGALLLQEMTGDCTVADCSFSACEASPTMAGFGGAIYVSADKDVAQVPTLTVRNSRFTSCVAACGGAITSERLYPYDEKSMALHITGCTFERNESTYSGGALWVEGDTTLANTRLAYNRAGSDGGAVCAGTSWADEPGYAGFRVRSLAGVVFEGNVAHDEEYPQCVGGAVATMSPGIALCVTRTAFLTNATDMTGGAIFAYEGSVSIATSVFSNNVVTAEGYDSRAGAVAAASCTSFAMTNVTVRGSRSGAPGAVYLYMTPGEVVNCVVLDNKIGQFARDIGIANGWDSLNEVPTITLKHSAYGMIDGYNITKVDCLANRTAADFDGTSLRLKGSPYNPVAAEGLVQDATDFEGVAYGSRPYGYSMGAYECATDSCAWSEPYEGVYDGIGHSITVGADTAIGGVQWYYSTSSATGPWLDSNPAFTNAGVYWVWACAWTPKFGYSMVTSNTVTITNAAISPVGPNPDPLDPTPPVPPEPEPDPQPWAGAANVVTCYDGTGTNIVAVYGNLIPEGTEPEILYSTNRTDWVVWGALQFTNVCEAVQVFFRLEMPNYSTITNSAYVTITNAYLHPLSSDVTKGYDGVATNIAPVNVEGLPVGVPITIEYAVDPSVPRSDYTLEDQGPTFARAMWLGSSGTDALAWDKRMPRFVNVNTNDEDRAYEVYYRVTVPNYAVVIGTNTVTITQRVARIVFPEAVKTYDGGTNLTDGVETNLVGAADNMVLAEQFNAYGSGCFAAKSVNEGDQYFTLTGLVVEAHNGALFRNYILYYGSDGKAKLDTNDPGGVVSVDAETIKAQGASGLPGKITPRSIDPTPSADPTSAFLVVSAAVKDYDGFATNIDCRVKLVAGDSPDIIRWRFAVGELAPSSTEGWTDWVDFTNVVYDADGNVTSNKVWCWIEAENYVPATNSAYVLITPRPITITADAKTWVYDDPLPTLTWQSATNLVAGETLDAVHLTFAQNPTNYLPRTEPYAGVIVLDGSYDPSVEIRNGSGELVSRNYAVTLVPGDLTVEDNVAEFTATLKWRYMAGSGDFIAQIAIANANRTDTFKFTPGSMRFCFADCVDAELGNVRLWNQLKNVPLETTETLDGVTYRSFALADPGTGERGGWTHGASKTYGPRDGVAYTAVELAFLAQEAPIISVSSRTAPLNRFVGYLVWQSGDEVLSLPLVAVRELAEDGSDVPVSADATDDAAFVAAGLGLPILKSGVVSSDVETGIRFAADAYETTEGQPVDVVVCGGSAERSTAATLTFVKNTFAKAPSVSLNGAKAKFPLVLSWPKGDCEPKVLTLTPVAAAKVSVDQYFTLQLGSPVGMAIGSCDIARVFVVDQKGSSEDLVPYVRALAWPANGGKVAGSGALKSAKATRTLTAKANKWAVFDGWYRADAKAPNDVTRAVRVTGEKKLKVGYSDAGTYFACFKDVTDVIAVNDPDFTAEGVSGITLDASNVPTATVGVPVSFPLTFTTQSGDKTGKLTVTKLPGGLKYNKKTGLVTGTPKKTGTFTVKVTGKNVAGKHELTFTLVVVPSK